MNQINLILRKNQDQIKAFCKRNHITKLSLFGSALRNEITEESDIDLLVEFHPKHIPGLIKFSGMENELSRLLERKVDLKTPQDLSIYFREEVLSTARVQYAEL